MVGVFTPASSVPMSVAAPVPSQADRRRAEREPTPTDRPGFWETLRAYIADEEPRTPAQIAAARAARDRTPSPPDPMLPPSSVRETLRAYVADQEPRPGR